MPETLKIIYEFEFKSGRKRTFPVHLDPRTITYQRDEGHGKPEWTKLAHCQCTNCPLRPEQTPYCPIAVNLAGLVDEFQAERSTEQVTVHVRTDERTYSRDASLQEGLFSILGIIMATSGCPEMNFLKPMARFHLPFSTHEETTIRSTSMYLLRQFFRNKAGKETDFELKKLQDLYSQVESVNEGILRRIRSQLREGDADANAIVILNGFAQILNVELLMGLTSYEYLFPDE